MNAPQMAALAEPGPGPVCRKGGVAGVEGDGGEAATRDELARRVLAFGMLLGWCASLLVFRMHQAASFAFAFLEWNLFLAVVPAVAGWLFARAAARRSSVVIQFVLFAVWFAFLPNAPYVMTDLVHLAPSGSVPLWYDLVLLGSCGGTGLLLGYTSLADVQEAISRKASAGLGWAVVVAALFLSGFGIYLGRFLRLNSWDAVTRPVLLLSDISHQLGDPGSSGKAIGFALIYGGGLLLGYIVLRILRAGIPESAK